MHYVIGDIHGQAAALNQLLQQSNFSAERDRLWCVGDLVNRGPDSLGVIQTLRSLGDSCQAVLGNHDLYLLACAEGLTRQRTCPPWAQEILRHPQADSALDWLTTLPLILTGPDPHNPNWIIVHAGVHPDWSLQEILTLNTELQQDLSNSKRRKKLLDLALQPPPNWGAHLTREQQKHAALHYLTRVRYLNPDYSMNLSKTAPPFSDKDRAWFQWPLRMLDDGMHLIFGHWAALEGRTEQPHIHAIDTGAGWDQWLTALTPENGQRISISCAPIKAVLS
ncbi:MAG: symmetrical bis(5'-nucleosyl)-tetraphosphatase [Gammaproteobacteria bacterium]